MLSSICPVLLPIDSTSSVHELEFGKLVLVSCEHLVDLRFGVRVAFDFAILGSISTREDVSDSFPVVLLGGGALVSAFFEQA